MTAINWAVLKSITITASIILAIGGIGAFLGIGNIEKVTENFHRSITASLTEMKSSFTEVRSTATGLVTQMEKLQTRIIEFLQQTNEVRAQTDRQIQEINKNITDFAESTAREIAGMSMAAAGASERAEELERKFVKLAGVPEQLEHAIVSLNTAIQGNVSEIDSELKSVLSRVKDLGRADRGVQGLSANSSRITDADDAVLQLTAAIRLGDLPAVQRLVNVLYDLRDTLKPGELLQVAFAASRVRENDKAILLTEKGITDLEERPSLDSTGTELLSQLYSKRAYAFGELGKAEASNSDYRTCIKLSPESEECLNNLGQALMDRGEFAEACEVYERAVSASGDSGIFGNVALCYGALAKQADDEKAKSEYFQRSIEAADAAFEHAENSTPTRPDELGQAAIIKAILLASSGDSVSAQQWAEKAFEHSPRLRLLMSDDGNIESLVQAFDLLVSAN